jgi:hypothetical protein
MPKKNASKSSSKSKPKRSSQANPEPQAAAVDVHSDEGPADPRKRAEPHVSEEDDSDDGLPHIKRRHLPEPLNPEQEQVLVEWFSENPLFFDQTHIHFKNRGKKDWLLCDKAKEFNMTGAELAVWFKSQRIIYGRLKKKKVWIGQGHIDCKTEVGDG